MKIKRTGRTAPTTAAKVGRALRRAAKDARRTARMYGVPIYVWENGKLVALTAWRRTRLSAETVKRCARNVTNSDWVCQDCALVSQGRGAESDASDETVRNFVL
jgi:hypothetical protein